MSEVKGEPMRVRLPSEKSEYIPTLIERVGRYLLNPIDVLKRIQGRKKNRDEMGWGKVVMW